MSDDNVQATVREIDGQLVLEDPSALGVIRAVAIHNCRSTLTGQADRVAHFVRRIADRGLNHADVVIVLLNVDDPNGGQLAHILMPDFDWQPIRDQGQVPFARGINMRTGIQAVLDHLDRDAAEELRALGDKIAVLVMDHGAIAVFEAP